MIYLLIFLIFLFPLGQLGRFPISGGSELVLQLNDLVALLIVFASLGTHGRKIFETIRNSRLSLPIFLWFFAMVLSLTANSTSLSLRELVISSLYIFRWITYAALFFCFVSLNASQKKLGRALLFLSALIVAAVGLAQFIFLPDVSFLKALHWDDHYFRVISTFLDPGFTGAVLVLGLVGVFLSTEVPIKIRRLSFVLIYGALALTYSRASYLMYLICFGAISFFFRSIKIFVLVSILLALTILILPKSTGEGTRLQRESSVWARIHNWEQSINVWKQKPVFGVGFDAYRYAHPTSAESHSGAGADSSLLLVLATTGVVGFASYLFLFFRIWQVSRRSVLLVSMFVGILIHSFFNNTLFYPWVMEWMWLMLALTVPV